MIKLDKFMILINKIYLTFITTQTWDNKCKNQSILIMHL